MNFLVSHSHSHFWTKLFEKKKKKRMADTRWFERCFLKWIELIASTHSGFFASFLLPLYVHDVSSTFIRLKVRSTTVRLLRLWSDMNKFCLTDDLLLFAALIRDNVQALTVTTEILFARDFSILGEFVLGLVLIMKSESGHKYYLGYFHAIYVEKTK